MSGLTADTSNDPDTKGMSPQALQNTHINLFFNAVRDNKLNIAGNFLKNNKLSPNNIRKNGFTPLQIAAANGHTNMVDLLMQYGALLETVDALGFTALFHAVYAQHFYTAKHLMVVHQANVKHRDNNQSNLLHICCFKQYFEIGHYLVTEFDNDWDVMDAQGRTPVHVAAAKGHAAFIHLFALMGFNLETSDKSSPPLTPLDYAQASLQHPFEYQLFLKSFEEAMQSTQKQSSRTGRSR